MGELKRRERAELAELVGAEAGERAHVHPSIFAIRRPRVMRRAGLVGSRRAHVRGRG
jgi:hypothetical protein